MNVRQELERARAALRRRERRRENALVATVRDTAMRAQYGFVVCALVDGSPINVMAWSPLALEPGQQVLVTPLTDQGYDWYALIGANATTDVETVPYSPPPLAGASLPAHALDGAGHTGTLPWARVSTAASKVDLASQVSGLLPASAQAPQTTVETVSFTVEADDGATVAGTVAAPALGYVRKLAVTGGAAMTLVLRESPEGEVEYATASSATPFSDPGGWVHLEADGEEALHYELTNDGLEPATFTVTLQIVAWRR